MNEVVIETCYSFQYTLDTSVPICCILSTENKTFLRWHCHNKMDDHELEQYSTFKFK